MSKAAAGRVLLIGYGNPSRGDDGLGPALAAEIEALGATGVTVDADYQLVVEHAHDAAGHEVVVFADADTKGAAPFTLRTVRPSGNGMGFSSHGVEPEDVLALARQLFGAAPRGYALGIRGYDFGSFRESLSAEGRANLRAALCFVAKCARDGTWDENLADGAAPETAGGGRARAGVTQRDEGDRA